MDLFDWKADVAQLEEELECKDARCAKEHGPHGVTAVCPEPERKRAGEVARVGHAKALELRLRGGRGQQALTAELLAKLPPIGTNENVKSEDQVAIVKFSSPVGRYTFYVTEFDGVDELFGYCVSPIGPDCDEWGYASLREIASLVLAGGALGIERDCYFKPTRMGEILKRGY